MIFGLCYLKGLQSQLQTHIQQQTRTNNRQFSPKKTFFKEDIHKNKGFLYNQRRYPTTDKNMAFAPTIASLVLTTILLLQGNYNVFKIPLPFLFIAKFVTFFRTKEV